MISSALLFLYLIAMAPKFLYERLKGKRHPGFSQRIGFSLPESSSKPVIWIHAISVGEIKATQPFFRELRKKYPSSFFLITTITETGLMEAKRSLPEADAFAYHPLDFKWIVKRWISHFKPALFILIESDFWPNLLSELKKSGSKVLLVSGKLSERSARRFKRFSVFTKKLFSHFDLLCVQNEEHKERFLPLLKDHNRIHITGNLKLDIEPQRVDQIHWQEKLQFLPKQPIITISCTHAPEEEMLLDALVQEKITIFLAPRHPERFEEIAQLLAKKKIPFLRWSELDGKQTPFPNQCFVILVNAMGQLPICYTFSSLAIVAGSYIDKIGGHNVLEPCLYGTPVFFGPHMHSQGEFATRVLEAKAGLQVPLEKLREAIHIFLNDSHLEISMRSNAKRLISTSRGTTYRTLLLTQSLYNLASR